MKSWRNREDRRTVRISVRVRMDDGWMDATVRNVSSRGMMLHSLQPLQRNQFVEISRGHLRVIGRIVWADAAMSGLRAQDDVDIAALLAKPHPNGAATPLERRQGPRESAPTRLASLEDRADASRLLGRATEKVFLLAAILCAALLAMTAARETLSAPLQKIGVALGEPTP